MVGFPNKPMGFPTKNDHVGVFWGYHHLRKHPDSCFVGHIFLHNVSSSQVPVGFPRPFAAASWMVLYWHPILLRRVTPFSCQIIGDKCYCTSRGSFTRPRPSWRFAISIVKPICLGGFDVELFLEHNNRWVHSDPFFFAKTLQMGRKNHTR